MSLTHQEDVSDYVSWSDDSRLVETSENTRIPTQTSSSTPQSTLLSLPFEVREEILKHLLVSLESFEDPLNGYSKGHSGMWYEACYPAILQTCHQLYYEGTNMLYSANEFQFTDPWQIPHFCWAVSGFEPHPEKIKCLSLVINAHDDHTEKAWLSGLSSLFQNKEGLDLYFPHLKRISITFPAWEVNYRVRHNLTSFSRPASLAHPGFEHICKLLVWHVRAPVVRVAEMKDYREVRAVDQGMEEVMSMDLGALEKDREAMMEPWRIRSEVGELGKWILVEMEDVDGGREMVREWMEERKVALREEEDALGCVRGLFGEEE